MRYSEKSKEQLKTCHSDLQTLFLEVIENYDCLIACGNRGEKEQNEAFAKKLTKLKYPDSKHNTLPSLAVDVVPYEVNKVDWSKLQSAHFAGYVKGVADELFKSGEMQHRIRCGADWDGDNDVNDTTFWDACHFEIVM
jgi:peptidoglycan L-alanyl-D-glutamate endopeptidase CwlK